MVYFGADEWDAPMSIHEMLNIADEELLALIPVSDQPDCTGEIGQC